MRALSLIPFLLLVAGGQAQKPAVQGSVLGRWTATSPRNGTDRPPVTVNFEKDRFTARMSGVQRGRKMTISMSGLYKVQGTRMSSRITDASLDPTPFTAAERKKMFTPEAKASFRKMIMRSGGPEGTIRFLGRDRFEMKTASGTVTAYVRSK